MSKVFKNSGKRMATESVQEAEVSSSMDTAGSSDMKMGGGSGSGGNGVGYRGSLVGNTSLSYPYSEHFHEIAELHSRKVKAYQFNWGFQRTKFANNGHSNGFALLPMYPPGTATGPNEIIPGQVLFQNSPLTTPNIGQRIVSSPMIQTINGRQPDGTTIEAGDALSRTAIYARDLGDFIYTNAVNITVDDLVDNKLFNFNASTPSGIMPQYRKFRLKHFTVECSAESYDTGENFTNLVKINNSLLNTPNEIGNQISYGSTARTQHIDQDYWVYRDIYTDYSAGNDYDVPCFPPESLSATNPKDTFSRAVKDVRNLDNQLTIMSNKEKFSFTRNIAPKGNYFLSLAQINNLQDVSASYLVAALEGINDPLNLVTQLPESFNFIFGPTNPPIWIGPQEGRAWDGTAPAATGNPVFCTLTTKLYVKYLATWEAFDFNYGVPQLELRLTEAEQLAIEATKERSRQALRKTHKNNNKITEI